jgi:hypothetical protein
MGARVTAGANDERIIVVLCGGDLGMLPDREMNDKKENKKRAWGTVNRFDTKDG